MARQQHLEVIILGTLIVQYKNGKKETYRNSFYKASKTNLNIFREVGKGNMKGNKAYKQIPLNQLHSKKKTGRKGWYVVRK